MRLINLGGILGALTGGAVVALANIDDAKPAFSIVMAGATLGMGVAWRGVTRGGGASDRGRSHLQVGPAIIGGRASGIGLRYVF